MGSRGPGTNDGDKLLMADRAHEGPLEGRLQIRGDPGSLLML